MTKIIFLLISYECASLDQTLGEISPASVVRDHLAPLLTPALTLATHSTSLIPPSMVAKNTANHDCSEIYKEANGIFNEHYKINFSAKIRFKKIKTKRPIDSNTQIFAGFSPKMRSKRSRTYSKKSPLQDAPKQIVEDQHTENDSTNPVTLTPKTLENESMAMSSLEQLSNNREVFCCFFRM